MVHFGQKKEENIMRLFLNLAKVVGFILTLLGIVMFFGTVGAYEVGDIDTLYFVTHLVIYFMPMAIGFIIYGVAQEVYDEYVF